MKETNTFFYKSLYLSLFIFTIISKFKADAKYLSCLSDTLYAFLLNRMSSSSALTHIAFTQPNTHTHTMKGIRNPTVTACRRFCINCTIWFFNKLCLCYLILLRNLFRFNIIRTCMYIDRLLARFYIRIILCIQLIRIAINFYITNESQCI